MQKLNSACADNVGMRTCFVPRHEVGHRAEQAVEQLVRSWGWQVLERNVRAGHLEIDIVARQGATLVIIEVRYRGGGAFTSGFGSLTVGKRRRIRQAGERIWHSRYRHDVTLERMRFDAAAVHVDSMGEFGVDYAFAAF